MTFFRRRGVDRTLNIIGKPRENFRSYLRKTYGMTLNDYLQLLKAQDLKCADCGRYVKNNRLWISKWPALRLVCPLCSSKARYKQSRAWIGTTVRTATETT